MGALFSRLKVLKMSRQLTPRVSRQGTWNDAFINVVEDILDEMPIAGRLSAYRRRRGVELLQTRFRVNNLMTRFRIWIRKWIRLFERRRYTRISQHGKSMHDARGKGHSPANIIAGYHIFI